MVQTTDPSAGAQSEQTIEIAGKDCRTIVRHRYTGRFMSPDSIGCLFYSEEEVIPHPHSSDEQQDDLTSVSGISESKATALQGAGYLTVDDIGRATVDDLADVEGIGTMLADRIKRNLGESA